MHCKNTTPGLLCVYVCAFVSARALPRYITCIRVMLIFVGKESLNEGHINLEALIATFFDARSLLYALMTESLNFSSSKSA